MLLCFVLRVDASELCVDASEFQLFVPAGWLFVSALRNFMSAGRLFGSSCQRFDTSFRCFKASFQRFDVIAYACTSSFKKILSVLFADACTQHTIYYTNQILSVNYTFFMYLIVKFCETLPIWNDHNWGSADLYNVSSP